jgi:hypothetical protein
MTKIEDLAELFSKLANKYPNSGVSFTRNYGEQHYEIEEYALTGDGSIEFELTNTIGE